MFRFRFACFVGSIILGEGGSQSTHNSTHPDQQSRSPHVMNRIPLCNERVKRMRGWKPRSTRVKGNERNTVKRMTRVEKERKGKVDGEPQQSGPIRLINIPPCTPLACIARFIAERHSRRLITANYLRSLISPASFPESLVPCQNKLAIPFPHPPAPTWCRKAAEGPIPEQEGKPWEAYHLTATRRDYF
jgi:hypothetical protein